MSMKKKISACSKFRRKYASGYLTVYLALSMTIMISLCLALIEGVRYNAIRLETECVMETGLQSVFGEYNRELFKQYNLFAIDSSYGTDVANKLNTEKHLERYIKRNVTTQDVFLDRLLYKDFLAMSLEDVEITKLLLLTDYDGKVFRRQAVQAIKDDVGLTLFDEVAEWMQVVETNNLLEMDVAEWKKNADEELQKYNGQQVEISEGEWKTINIENPTEQLERIRNSGILSFVVEDVETISNRCIATEEMVSNRIAQGQINQGNMQFEALSPDEDLIEQYLFLEYLLKYMGCFGNEDDSNALCYQIEYILIGENSDGENLKSLVNRLLAIREAANAIYIFSDEEKCMEAELAALVICSVFQMPALTDTLKTVLLLAWSFGEGLHDVQVLLQGGTIPLMKDKSTWYFSLENVLTGFGAVQDQGEGTGLSYKDYLRILMMFTESETLARRAMNLVEADIRRTSGNERFRLDACYVKLEAVLKIKSAYGYNFEITRTKEY